MSEIITKRLSVRKKKYNIIKNTSHGIDGFLEVLKNETPVQIEVALFIGATVFIAFLDISNVLKAILFFSMFPVIIAEMANSAIERAVDLVTLEYNEMAKKAKDAAAAIVLVSVVFTVLVWSAVFVSEYLF
jgi:diacylglycerol kinase (ATP)